MTVPPLTERLKDAAAHAGAKYLTALLLETAEAVEFATEKIDSLSQSAADLDTARQAAEARVAALTEALRRIVDCLGTTYWDDPSAGVEQIARDALAGAGGGER